MKVKQITQVSQYRGYTVDNESNLKTKYISTKSQTKNVPDQWIMGMSSLSHMISK